MRRTMPIFVAVLLAPVALLDLSSFEALASRGRELIADASDTPSLAKVERIETALSARALATVALPELDAPAEEPSAASVDWGELPAPPADEDEEDAPVEAADSEDDQPILASIQRETWVFAEPRWKSRRLGYLRSGAIVSRDPEPVSRRGCRRGWYKIEPRGYVCPRGTATVEKDHPVVQLSQRRPDMWGLPYTYVQSRFPTPPFYVRLPTIEQQKRIEPSLDLLLRKHERLQQDADYVAPPEPQPLPYLLADNATIPGLGGKSRGDAVIEGRARVRSGFALLGSYMSGDRQFGLTTEMHLIPLDRTRIVKPSTMTGATLSDEMTLPVAIARSKHARVYAVDDKTGAWSYEGKLPFRAVVALSGKIQRHRGHDYHEMLDGRFVKAEKVVRVDRFKNAPRWAQQGKKWIDVSILKQSLTAYEGTRPVFTTLVSTGADGLADAAESHATIQGTFLIHTKHISVTMDGDEAGDEFDLRDVPFVQYFHEGYALHGAYWHDDFGVPRSHGCVNLSPQDAAWLFRWTDPEVPQGWHASLSLKKGTTVYIHP